MNKGLLWLILAGMCGHLHAQRLFQPPFISYVGRGIEDHKISLFGQLPYEGIGKKMLFEQYPQLWSGAFNRFSTPSHALVDAFGVMGTNSPGYSNNYTRNKTQATLLTDQHRNLELDLLSRFEGDRFTIWNRVNQQIKTPADANHNQRLDYTPGKQFNTYNFGLYDHEGIRAGFSNYFTTGKEWGGSRFVRTQKEANLPLEGFLRDAQHWQLSLWANYDKVSWGTWGLAVDLNQHRQNQDWKTYNYLGKEHQTSYLLTYRYEYAHNQFYGAMQYVRDQATETVDSLQIQLKDQYWRGIAEWRSSLSSKFYFQIRLNAEKRLEQRLIWRPAAQFDWSLDKKHGLVLGLFANAGQRLNKPLTLHLDRLSDGYSVGWNTQPYEVAHKIGLTFKGQKNANHFTKLVLDRTWFKNKVITQWNHPERSLVFYSANTELRRDALEFTVGTQIKSSPGLHTHLMYRWEHLTPDLKLPFQAAHAAQLRVQWVPPWKGQINAHYLLRGAQQILNVRPVASERAVSSLYHRVDLSYTRRFQNPQDHSFFLQIQCINVLGAGKSKEKLETDLLWPDAQEPYWSDPQLRNLQLSIRYEF